MSGALQTRRFLKTGHVIHAGSFLVLLATGALLFAPTLRARLIGGYSLHLRFVHCWAGVVFAVATLPFVVTMLSPRGAAGRAAPEGSSALRRWRGAHRLFTVGSVAAFTVTGIVLWQQDRFGLAAIDSSATIHRWLTVLAAALLAAHLSVAVLAPALRALSVARRRRAADRETSLPVAEAGRA
jgi:cytochrome b subunit of formate dehydrogenase